MMTRQSRVIVLATTFACLALWAATAQGLEAHTPDTDQRMTVSEAPPRFGVGWDDGVALRLRLGERWGLGVRVNPDLIDAENDTSYSYTSQEVGQDPGFPPPGPRWTTDSASESDSQQEDNLKTLGLSAMAYYERDFGRWFAAGPYLGINYTRRSYDSTARLHDSSSWKNDHPYWPSDNDYESWADVETRNWERSVGVELGLRPVLRLHDRFALETRVGLEMLFTDWSEKGEETRRWTSDYDSGGRPEPIPVDVVRTQSGGEGTSTSTIDNSGSSTRFRAVGDRVLSDVQIRFIVFF